MALFHYLQVFGEISRCLTADIQNTPDFEISMLTGLSMFNPFSNNINIYQLIINSKWNHQT